MHVNISRRDILSLGGAAALMTVAGLDWPARADEPQLQPQTGLQDAFKDGKYVLPKLPFALNALEPLYQERMLTIHYTKHHAAYVEGLNSTLEKIDQARKAGDYGATKALSRDLSFNGSGHILHCLFWHSMKPGGGESSKEFSDAMEKSFGSTTAAHAQFAAATKMVEGSGWGILAYEPVADKIIILQSEKHQNLTFWASVPLLVCDVWEHAYYLQYANDRGAWVDNFMKLANWQLASQRFMQARRTAVKA
jgi:superoxide dismutase, Fe-Mn family